MTETQTAWPLPVPLPVRWDRTVLHPDPLVPGDPTIIGCLTETGYPVALVLDEDLREALGLQLLAPEGDAEVDPQHLELTREIEQLRGELAQARSAALTEASERLTWMLNNLVEGNPRRPGVAFSIGVVQGVRDFDGMPAADAGPRSEEPAETEPDDLMAELTEAKAYLRSELVRGRKGRLYAERADETIDRYQRALKDVARLRHRAELADEIVAALLAVDPIEWALAGQRAGADAAQLIRRLATTPTSKEQQR